MAGRRRRQWLWSAGLLISALGCGGAGKFVWVDQYKSPTPPPKSHYVLSPGDKVQVRVYNQDGMSASVRVRPDGKITLPFLNDVQAAGYEPAVLGQQLQVRLKDFINNPVVTVTVEETHKMEIPIVGEVSHPGVTLLPDGAGVLEGVLTAGGLSDFADDEMIFVVRAKPQAARIRFKYDALLKPGSAASEFHLQAGDIVVVQ